MTSPRPSGFGLRRDRYDAFATPREETQCKTINQLRNQRSLAAGVAPVHIFCYLLQTPPRRLATYADSVSVPLRRLHARHALHVPTRERTNATIIPSVAHRAARAFAQTPSSATPIAIATVAPIAVDASRATRVRRARDASIEVARTLCIDTSRTRVARARTSTGGRRICACTRSVG